MQLKDMPQGWLEFLEGHNALCNAMKVNKCMRFMDEMKFGEAKSYGTMILDKSSEILPLQRYLLELEMIFCDLFLGTPMDQGNLFTTGQNKIRKLMKDFPSIIRLEYAVVLLLGNDERLAEEKLKHFESIQDQYPYQGEIKSEREILEKVLEKYETSKKA